MPQGGFYATNLRKARLLTGRNIRRNESENERLVALVFAHPSQALTQSMSTLIPYWDCRSKEAIDFFFLGYGETADEFYDEEFVNSVEELERDSSWQYSGRVSTVVCRASLPQNGSDNGATFDYDAVLDWRIADAIDSKIMSSAEELFEQLIRSAKKHKRTDELSDAMGLPELGRAIWQSILDNLPLKGLDRALHTTDFWSIKSR